MKRIDETGFGNLKIVQNTDQFCYGVDAVLLADFAKLKRSDAVLDMCSGNGIIPLILAHKYGCRRIIGVELQKEPYELSLESLKLNAAELADLGSEILFVNSDVLCISGKDLCRANNDTCQKKGFVPKQTIPENIPFHTESFSAICCNPPYFESGSGVDGKDAIKHAARFETTAQLEDFVRIAAGLLCDKGSFSLIHRPSRLPDIFEFLRKYDLEPKRIKFVSDCPGKAPKQVLIQAVKNAGKELIIEPQLYVHGDVDGYSRELRKIYERL